MKNYFFFFILTLGTAASGLAQASAMNCDNGEPGVDFLSQNEYHLFSKIRDVNKVSPSAADYLFKRIKDVQVCKAATLEALNNKEDLHSARAFNESNDGTTRDLLLAVALGEKEMFLNTELMDNAAALLILQAIAKELIPGEDFVSDRRARALSSLLNGASKKNAVDFAAELQKLDIDFSRADPAATPSDSGHPPYGG
jgi:hypothetical protein